MNSKKIRIATLAVIALLIAFIGGTYAYWFFTKSQQTDNLVSSACLDITLDNESAAINLGSQYPLADEDGMKLTPYTFTVTNNCNTSVEYQVALEAIGTKSTSIKSSAIKVALDNSSKLYSHYGEVEATINGAYESRSIGYGKLTSKGSEGSSVSHSLRIWIDENAPVSEANKTFQSKISVTIGQGIEIPYSEGTMAYDILKNNGGENAASLFSVTYVSETAAENYSSVSKTANYWYGTDYTFDEETGVYQLRGELVQASCSELFNVYSPHAFVPFLHSSKVAWTNSPLN